MQNKIGVEQKKEQLSSPLVLRSSLEMDITKKILHVAHCHHRLNGSPNAAFNIKKDATGKTPVSQRIRHGCSDYISKVL